MAANLLASHAGSWTGTNGFRMMPDDEFVTGPAYAEVRLASAGNLTTLAYTWEHPTDGAQEGVLVLWASDDTGASIRAVLSDSWHQQPDVMELAGRAEAGVVALEGTYAATWGWRIAIEHGESDALRMVMSNVVPTEQAPDPDAAGPYEVMVTHVAR
jgi:hypothetical protein